MNKPSCFSRRLGNESCHHTCLVSDECHGDRAMWGMKTTIIHSDSGVYYLSEARIWGRLILSEASTRKESRYGCLWMIGRNLNRTATTYGALENG